MLLDEYFQQVRDLLSSDVQILALGFQRQDINFWPKGMNHAGVLKITKSNWEIDGKTCGPYHGVDVHFEAERYGALNLHCELTPRSYSETRADQVLIEPLLKLKGRVTHALRRDCEPLLRFVGANLHRICPDASSPKSLKVMGFDLGLPEGHEPEQYAGVLRSLLQLAVPLIDRIVDSVRSEMYQTM